MSKRKKRPVLVSKILSWIAFQIYMFLFSIVERLSVKHADQFGRFLGGLLFYFSCHRRKIVEENSIWIVEACSSDEARSIATKHFANVSGFNIRNIKEVWSY